LFIFSYLNKKVEKIEEKDEDKLEFSSTFKHWIFNTKYACVRTSEFTSVTLKTSALSLRGESLSHTYVGDSFSMDPYVAFTYGLAFLPNRPTRPVCVGCGVGGCCEVCLFVCVCVCLGLEWCTLCRISFSLI
jgi:hypothetical protein